MSGVGIRIYNTMTQAKQAFTPLQPGKVGIHIGNARTFTSFDVIVRYLRYRGFDVRYVRNYTDVDDKIINAAKETGEDPAALAERFVQAFEEDARGLGLLPPDVSPRVTQV